MDDTKSVHCQQGEPKSRHVIKLGGSYRGFALEKGVEARPFDHTTIVFLKQHIPERERGVTTEGTFSFMASAS
jgi:hypothetical protein